MNLLPMAAQVVGGIVAMAALPLLLELLVLSFAALFPRCPVLSVQPFALAVVVPAHNEQALIGACVRSLAGAPVYVVAHNCSDQTAAHASAAGATVLPLNDGLGGKGRALDHGFSIALAQGAQGVLVIDADSVTEANLLAAVRQRLAAGAAAVQCRYEVANPAATARTRLAALAFLGMNVVRPRGRSALGLSCGIFGNGFALAASTLGAVPYTANSLVEDLEYHLHLLNAGLRVEFIDEARVLGEMPNSGAGAGTQRARWEGGRTLMRRTWTLPLLRAVAAGRVRMLEPLLDLLAFPLATEVVLLLALALLAIPAHSPWLLGFAALGLGSVVLYVLVSAAVGPTPAKSLQALLAAPGYLLWKILMLPKTRLAGRRDAAWVRTKRNAESD